MKKLIINEIKLISGGSPTVDFIEGKITYNSQTQTCISGFGVDQTTQIDIYSIGSVVGTQTGTPHRMISRKNMLLLGINLAVFATSLAFFPKSKKSTEVAEEEQSYCEKKCVKNYS
jgi:hypothetical protein